MSAEVIHGDCLDVMRGMPDASVDAVITDPPYGLGFPYEEYDDTRENLVSLINNFLPHARRIARHRVVVLCGPTQIGMYPQPEWVGAVTWNTTGSHGRYGFSQWTPVLLYGKDVKGFGSVNGCLKSDTIALAGGGGVGFTRSEEERKHTCPKPLTTMRAVVRRYTNPADVVLDPFAGSGTTGVACAMEARGFVGVERTATYVDIARRRIADAQAQTLLGVA
jgi:DNA modification methylase